MNVKITSATLALGQVVMPGDEIDLPEKDARFLIAIGKAKAVKVVQTPPSGVMRRARRP